MNQTVTINKDEAGTPPPTASPETLILDAKAAKLRLLNGHGRGTKQILLKILARNRRHLTMLPGFSVPLDPGGGIIRSTVVVTTLDVLDAETEARIRALVEKAVA